jgi:hypothetical protein
LKPVAPDLPQRYYLYNFESLCSSVWLQYRDLLDESEQDFYHRFNILGEEARCLYVRLVSRRGPLFRVSQLSYAELGELSTPIAELLKADLLCTALPDLEQLFRLYRKPELQQMFAGYLAGGSTRLKADMLSELQSRELSPQEVLACWRNCSDEQLLQPLAVEVVELYQLLFFGNRYQSLTDFVLTDLGVANYFPYPLDAGHRMFSDRSQVEDYLFLSELRERYYASVEAGDEQGLHELVPLIREFTCSTALLDRRDRLCNRLARQLERSGDLELALDIYALSSSHPARERRVRVLQARQQLETGLELCEEILQQPWCEAEQDFAERHRVVLGRKLGLDIPANRVRKFAEEIVRLPATDSSVELAAAAWLSREWDSVQYLENTLFNALFGLAFWEQIFQAIPGAFVNPFQLAPLDMYSPEFYHRRREVIDERMEELERVDDLSGELLKCFQCYRGYSNSWVNWRAIDEQMLALALNHIPRQQLLAIWRRILFDPRANRSGFPDLLALDPQRGYLLVEVKGPGDQLQQNQKRWLRFFSEQAVPWQVLRVEWEQ